MPAFNHHEENPVMDYDEQLAVQQYQNNHLEELRAMQPQVDDITDKEQWDKSRADVYSDKAYLLTNAITTEKVFSSTLPEITNALEKLDKMERLERGMATENVDVMIDSIERMTSSRLRKKTIDLTPIQEYIDVLS